MAKSGRKPVLMPAELAEARLFYETTKTTFLALGEKYGISEGAMFEWAKKQGWVKYRPPDRPLSVEEEAKVTRDIEEAAQLVHDSALAAGLSEVVKRRSKRRRKPPKRVRKSQAGKKKIYISRAEMMARLKAQEVQDQLQQPIPDPEPEPIIEDQEAKIDLSRKTGATASIIQFPRGKPPPRKEVPLIFPTRTREERAQLKQQLAGLRAVLSLQQIAQLERHENLLADYTHLMQVYLSTHEYVDTTKCETEEEAQDMLHRVQRAAMSRLLPTERDTLSGALKTLTHALAQTIHMKRLVSGIAKNGRLPGVPNGNRDADSDEEDSPTEDRTSTTALDLGTLRSIRTAMQALTGEKDRATDPPKPPEPESLSDLVVDRPSEPETPR